MGVLEHALAYLAAGVSVFPVLADGSKAPAGSLLPRIPKDGGGTRPSWSPLRERLATEEEARRWWADGRHGIAVVCGAISGLECIDFDNEAQRVFPLWRDAVRADAPGLYERLTVHRSPRGYHVWIRCLDGKPEGNQDLAIDPMKKGKERVLIQTRGEGGYALAPGCPAGCHETGRPWEFMEGRPLASCADLTADERDTLMSAARYLSGERKPDPMPPKVAGQDLRPGDDFEARGTWEEALGPGWAIDSQNGDEIRWRRPGKGRGCSATTGRCKGQDGADLFHVFTSSADPFEAGKSYGKFWAYSLTQTAGNLSRAASLLRTQGYGPTPKERKPRAATPKQENARAEAAAEWTVRLDGEVLASGTRDTVLELAGVSDDGPVNLARTFEMRSLGSILKAVFPPPRWLVYGIMSEGLNLLIGSPKQGKSLMALNLALTIAGGGLALQDIPVTAAGVLYLSLEDQLRRIQERAVKMLRVLPDAVARAAAARLTVSTDWPRQDNGGLRLIDLWLKRTADPGLVIIDVWNRFSPERAIGGNAYEQDAQFMGEVQHFAIKRGVGVLVVHHTRKSPAGAASEADFVASSSGTQGLTGSADGIMVLVRARNEMQAELKITGRDVDERELVLEFDKTSLTWRCIGTSAQHLTGKVQTAIITYLRERGSFGASCPEIAGGVGEKENSIRQALSRMLTTRAVTRRGNLWLWPGPSGDEVLPP